MRKIVIALGILCSSWLQPVMAQTQKDEIDMVQTIWGKEKKAFIAEMMDLSGDDLTKFNTVFDEYLTDRKKLGMDRINIINAYADNYDKLDDAKAKDLTEGVLKNNTAINKLHSKFYKKMSKSLSPLKASQWLQWETYIDVVVREALLSELPFIQPGKPKQ